MKAQDVINQFNMLSYDEKVGFFRDVLLVKNLSSEHLDIRFTLVAQCIGIYRIYKRKNPEARFDTFIKKLIGIQKDDSFGNSWLDNFLPFAEAFSEGCTEINLGNSKKVQDFKDKISAILDTLLPF